MTDVPVPPRLEQIIATQTRAGSVMPQTGGTTQPNTTQSPPSVAYPPRAARRRTSRYDVGESRSSTQRQRSHPLRLGRAMRTRLSVAVRALIADPRLAGCTDTQLLATVLLMGKTNHHSGRVQTTARELGRWMGITASTVDHEVFPPLVAAKALTTEVVTAASGRVEGVSCRVEPVWEVRGQYGAALALTKKEFAVLLRLLEALFAPGWAGVETPPGLLAGREGRGAATDRLALLLLVLEAREDGTVPLVGGTVKDGRGRCAATLARLLGCSVSGGSKVLTRLRRWKVVETPSRRMRTGMRGKQVLLVPAVADASAGRGVGAAPRAGLPDGQDELAPAAPAVPPGCTACAAADSAGEDDQAPPLAGQRWWQESFEDLLAERPAAASGDLEDGPDINPAGQGPVSDGIEAAGSVIAERPDTAYLHALHAGVATVEEEGAGDRGFSGSAVGGGGGRRERARAREDAPGSSSPAPGGAAGGPLRGEKPGQLRADKSKSGQARWVFGPAASVPQELSEALGPVAGLWSQLGRASTRRWLVGLVQGEVGRLRGLVGPELAQRVLAERLERRLEAQGTRPVTDLVGWLVKRGLPQRPGCWSRVCDEGLRMDTRGACESCQVLVGDRRGLRQRVADQVLEERLSGRLALAEREVRREVERRLQEAVREELARKAAARERAVAEQVVREASYELKRQAYDEAKHARAAAPCEDCGLPEAAGLCLRCTERRGTETAVRHAVEYALVLRYDRDDAPGTQAMWQDCERATRAVLAERLDRLREQGHDEDLVAYTGRRLIEELRDRRRRAVVVRLGQHEEAEQAARLAAAARRRKQRQPHTAEAREAVRAAGEAARKRVAEQWLGELLAELRVMCSLGKTAPADRTDWDRVLPELAVQALPEDADGAVRELVNA
ncbi:hypothetical protein SHJG_0049 [Streptomyces hygroscopicus subsp. jinggangensis 5008]|nr:hypothetical protein SHJG_0049 [Streptomyces hygroscopicus subsp. jinggangensis 5008]AGF59717.1 hypothetical protein SHJGH_0051 [Streptomyces hygroscopicus subsp. jinggangensis TL01]